MAILPFVFDRNSPSLEIGSVYYEYAVQIAPVAWIAGGLSLYVFEIHCLYTIILYTICIMLLYISASGVTWFYNLQWILVLLVAISNYLTTFTLTMVFLEISNFPRKESSENALKSIGTFQPIAVIIGTIVTFFIMRTTFSCFTGN